MPTKASRFPICGSGGNGIRYGRIRVFKKFWPRPSQRLSTSKDRLDIERRLQITFSRILRRPKPAELLVLESASSIHSISALEWLGALQNMPPTRPPVHQTLH